MNKVLDKKYPYLTNFFETALKSGRLFHSIILYGSNSYMQYAMALELARRLNCIEDGREDCNCRSCRWIRENKHPAVMTISKIDNKSAADTSKTVISVQQTETVLNAAFNSSDYKKVFIFCDADIITPDNTEKEEYEEFKETGFNAPQEAEGKIWIPSSINRKCFQEASANSMLKSIEEPSEGVTFIFLTDSSENLISTIVSRSQAFYMPYVSKDVFSTDFFSRYFEKYPYFDASKALDFAEALLNYQKESSREPEYIISCLQYYLTELLKAYSSNSMLASRILRDIKQTEEAKKMLKACVKEQPVYEHLAFYFAEPAQ